MKFFKKALIATAILATAGAQAATVTSKTSVNGTVDVIQLSKEGAAIGVQGLVTDLILDVTVAKNHPSQAQITLSFDKTELDIASCGTPGNGVVLQGVGSGTAYCGNVGFNYGTGSFTFDDVVYVDGNQALGQKDTLTFKVNLGNPLYADSGFRVFIGAHGYDATPSAFGPTVKINGATTLEYKSVVSSTDNTEIEKTSLVMSEEVSQYSFTVSQDLDGVIARDNPTQWVTDSGVVQLTDTLGYTVTNDESLGLAILGSQVDVDFDGSFTDIGSFDPTTNLVGTVTTSNTNVEVALDDGFGFTSGAKDKAVDVITFTNNGATIPRTGTVDAKAVVMDHTTPTGTLPVGGWVIDTDADAGMWDYDATIINVPYLPVNYAGTSSSVHFANESQASAAIFMTAIDDDGVEYARFDLADLAAHKVTKVTQTEITAAWGLTDSTKLSVTFFIAANNGDVNAYAFSTSAAGRAEISTSQQRK